MNYRTALWALFFLELASSVNTMAMNHFGQPPFGPAPMHAIAAPSPRTTWESIKAHIADHQLAYTLLAVGGLCGIVAFAEYQTRSHNAKIVKNNQEKNLELSSFSDTEFLKTLTKFVATQEKHYHQEITSMLTIAIDDLPLSTDEKAQLQTGLETFSFAQQKNDETEELSESLCAHMKTYFARGQTEVKRLDLASYKQEIKGILALLEKGKAQLSTRQISWNESTPTSKRGQLLLERMNVLSFDLKAISSLLSYVQLEEFCNNGDFCKEECIIAQHMSSKHPLDYKYCEHM